METSRIYSPLSWLTAHSQLPAVPHPSTNPAQPCLASEIRRDRVRSGCYGRRPNSQLLFKVVPPIRTAHPALPPLQVLASLFCPSNLTALSSLPPALHVGVMSPQLDWAPGAGGRPGPRHSYPLSSGSLAGRAEWESGTPTLWLRSPAFSHTFDLPSGTWARSAGLAQANGETEATRFSPSVLV